MARRGSSRRAGGNLGAGGVGLRPYAGQPRAAVKKPASPRAAARSVARAQQPGVASGKGLGLKATPIKPAKTVTTPKSSGPKRMPSPRQGTTLGTPGRHG